MIIQYPYLLTISSKRARYVSKEDLDEIYRTLVKSIRNCDWTSFKAYELGKRTTLHMHTIFTRSMKIQNSYKAKLTKKFPGYYLDFTELDNTTLPTVEKYIRKQVSNKVEQEQILCQNYYKYNHAFDMIRSSEDMFRPFQDI